jgi:hypothetical protein
MRKKVRPPWFPLPSSAVVVTINNLPYQQAFERIRGEYREMPGMRLTPAQIERLSGVEISVCRLVLDDLVRAQFLSVRPDGTYARGTADAPSRLGIAKTDWTATLTASRRAS